MTRTSLGLGLLLGGLSIALFGACSSGKGSSGPASGGAGATDGGAGSGGGGTGGGTGGVGGGTGGGSSVDCKAVCEKFASANCPNADPQATCETDCAAFISSCPTETQGFGDCIINTGTVSCNADGDLEFKGCNTQLSGFLVCSACEAVSGDDACETCGKNSCCNERKALFGDANLFDLIDCFAACADATCFQGCQTQYPTTYAAFEAFSNCQSTNCSNECTTP